MKSLAKSVVGTTLVLLTMAACGPSSAELDPKSVVDLKVRPASGQLLFCPGDPFLVEVVAKMNDGSTCSSNDATRTCLGQTNTLIDRDQIDLGLTSGSFDPSKELVVIPEADPFKTAQDGMELRASILGVGPSAGTRSVVGTASLKPVYDCRLQASFGGGVATGPVAAAGPELTLAATSLSTPFYPDAMLVRLEGPGGSSYWISPSSDRVLEFIAAGQSGQAGAPGAAGAAGPAGTDNSAVGACIPGGDGGPGTDGAAGSNGGDGGVGGTFRVRLDESVADKLLARLKLLNPGGAAGSAGAGGAAGPGGPGGAGGPANELCPNTAGKPGKPGNKGADGLAGKPGAAGPAPLIERLPRASLFASELKLIESIESAKAAGK